jgi:transposase InsO family protein
LQTLPVVFGFERIHVDLAGPFSPSEEGFKYVMIIVDSFTSWVVLVGLLDKASKSTMAAIRDGWITVYGAPSTCVSDNGLEWEGKFSEYLRSCGITQRFTSPDHPQGNGKAENIVKSVKRMLRAYVADMTDVTEWGSKLGYLGMAFRFTRHGSLRLSPFQLVFGMEPNLPNNVAVVMDQPLYDDNAVEQAVSLTRKVEALSRYTPLARDSQQQANLRNEARYQETRSGNYVRKVKWYVVGDFVFLQRKTVTNVTLHTRASPGIYRVVQVLPSGILVLQGRCGLTIRENGINCAPCWVSRLDTNIDIAAVARRVDSAVAALLRCEICTRQDSAADASSTVEMGICSLCATGWHATCLSPSLLEFPPDDVPWYCPYCVRFQFKQNV